MVEGTNRLLKRWRDAASKVVKARGILDDTSRRLNIDCAVDAFCL